MSDWKWPPRPGRANRQPHSSPEELILAMLRDVLARQAAAMGYSPAESEDFFDESEAQDPSTDLPEDDAVVDMAAEAPVEESASHGVSTAVQPNLPEATDLGVGTMLKRLGIGIFLVAMLINVPLYEGRAMARALPDKKALIVRDGLVLKGPGPEIYVLEDNRRRWISSLDAFDWYGFTWNDVHVVGQERLDTFPEGRALHVLLMCEASPHIYRLEHNRKRWIKDIPTLEAEGHVWEDVKRVTCSYIDSLPDGPPIPPDAGTPPG